MKTKTKIILILLGTLVIGIILGAAGDRAFVHMRIKEFLSVRTQKGFQARMEKIIEPTADQQAKVMAVVNRYAVQLTTLHEQFRTRIMGTLKSFRDELFPLLTLEQRQRLDKQFQITSHFFGGPKHPIKNPN